MKKMVTTIAAAALAAATATSSMAHEKKVERIKPLESVKATQNAPASSRQPGLNAVLLVGLAVILMALANGGSSGGSTSK